MQIAISFYFKHPFIRNDTLSWNMLRVRAKLRPFSEFSSCPFSDTNGRLEEQDILFRSYVLVLLSELLTACILASRDKFFDQI